MDSIMQLPPDSPWEWSLCELVRLYTALEREILRWQRDSGLTCPPGCGSCCENFEPEVHPVESDYLAIHLHYRQPHWLDKVQRPHTSLRCLFYTAGETGHCAVYPARPLLCRLFAFAALKNRRGEPSFRLCAYMRPELQPRLYTAEELGAAFGSCPPLMQDYGLQVGNLVPGSRPDPLRRQLQRSLQKIGLGKQLQASALQTPGRLPPGVSTATGSAPPAGVVVLSGSQLPADPATRTAGSPASAVPVVLPGVAATGSMVVDKSSVTQLSGLTVLPNEGVAPLPEAAVPSSSSGTPDEQLDPA